MQSLRSVASRRTALAGVRARPAMMGSFHTAAVRQAGQESSLNRDSRAEEAESHKQDQLDKVKKGTNEWKPELASDSESAIKADRSETKDTAEDLKKLQDETAGHAAEKHQN